MTLWYLLFGLLAATIAYFALKCLKNAHFLFREYYVLWNVAVGGRSDRRKMSHKIRLHAYVCKTALLDSVSVNELYSFAKGMMHSDFSIHEFHKVILTYKHALFCRDRTDGSLRGMMFLGIDNCKQGGESYTVIRLGLSFFQNFYRGGPLLYYFLAYMIFKELITHPLTPLYVLGKLFTYKSYLAAMQSLSSAYPRYDAPTPPFEKRLIDEFGRAIAGEVDVYDEKTGVIQRERTTVKVSVVPPLTDTQLENPHLRFFQEQNPNWAKGHQMCSIARITWGELLRVLYKAILRARRGRKDKEPPVSPRGQFFRGFSFQDERTNKYAVTYYEMDVIGYEEKSEEEGKEVDGVSDCRSHVSYESQASEDPCAFVK